MLARTKHREAYNTGTVNRAVENGYDLIQISDHGAEDSCKNWEGKILSLNGQTAGYETLTDAEESDDHIFGPNCRHTFAIYVSSLARATSAFTPGRSPLDGGGRFRTEAG
jgi:hypothetical protein